MKTTEALAYVLEHDKEANKYRLAKALGVSHTTIANYAAGRTKMNSEAYKKWIEIYPSVEIDDAVELNKDYQLGVLK